MLRSCLLTCGLLPDVVLVLPVFEGLAAEQTEHLRDLLPQPPLPAPRCLLPIEASKVLGRGLEDAPA